MPDLLTTRFAPSPTGYLHLGHAHAALVAWLRARQAGGRFLLRIEDIDPGRCRPEYFAAIFEDLAWLGLDWDGTPRVQSEHGRDYAAALARLGDLVYPCFCTRADIAASVTAPHGPDGAPLYPGTCRALSAATRAERMASERYALRLDMARASAQAGPLGWEEEGRGWLRADPAAFGDVVLARKDALFSYHLCVTHDDALSGVTLVTRGNDLLPATSVHRLLQAVLGWPAPRYAHHPVLTDEHGRRLAKRDAALTVRAMRGGGMSPAETIALASPFFSGRRSG